MRSGNSGVCGMNFHEAARKEFRDPTARQAIIETESAAKLLRSYLLSHPP